MQILPTRLRFMLACPTCLTRTRTSSVNISDDGWLVVANDGKSIFTAEDVREIRRLHEEGNRQVDIAKSYGVDRRTIWDVIHKSWQWL